MESSVKKMNKTRKDKEFFEEIYNTTFAGLRKFVTYRCTNSALVDDILQEVYIEVFRHIDQLREHENIAGWVYKTADNKTKKLNEVYHRYYSNKTDIEEWNLTYEESELAELIQTSEYQSILSEDEFLLLMMKYKEGYSHQEIAKIKNITESNSKMKLSRIIRKLKNGIELQIILAIILLN